MLLKKVRGRDRDRTDLMKCEDREPELVVTLEDQHDAVAVLDAEALEVVCCHRGVFLHLFESEAVIGLSVFCDPHHGCLVRIFVCHRIHEVESEVELIGFRCVGDGCQLIVCIQSIRYIFSVYRILNSGQVEIGLVIFYIRSLNSLLVSRALGPLLRI